MIRLRGVALHSGHPSEIAIDAAERVTWNGVSVEALEIARLDQGVAIRAGDTLIDLVEHAFAALGGLSVSGASVEVIGGEVPLLDGGAARLAGALREAGARRGPRRRRIVRRTTVTVGDSTYRFEPSSAVVLEVEIDFDHPAIGRQAARWEGDEGDFVARIAGARTFGFLRDHARLLARGRARGATLSGLLVFDAQGLAEGCAGGAADEPVRHKLLDFIGDLELTGGVPIGRIVATRPGHAATHAAIAEATRQGALGST